MAFANKKNKRKKIKKDYQSKDLSNPFFRKKEKKKPKASFFWFKFVGILALFVLLFWSLFILSYWDISDIDIKNTERVSPDKIERKVLEQMDKKSLIFFSQNNIFLFKSDSLVDELKEECNLSDIKIQKKLPNKLAINVTEKPYSYIYSEKEDYFFCSSDNYLISPIEFIEEQGIETEDQSILKLTEGAETLTDDNVLSTEAVSAANEVVVVDALEYVGVGPTEKSNYLIIENKNKNTLIKNEEKVSLKDEYLSFIFDLDKELKKHPELEVDRFIIADHYFNSIFAKIKDGPQIYFNVNLEIDKQLENLFFIKNSKLKDNFKLLEYIDLRYGDKVYFFPENVIN